MNFYSTTKVSLKNPGSVLALLIASQVSKELCTSKKNYPPFSIKHYPAQLTLFAHSVNKNSLKHN